MLIPLCVFFNVGGLIVYLLFQNEWSIRHFIERNEDLVLRETSL